MWGRGPNRFLVREVEALEPGRALDLACGPGRNAVWLAERGWRVTAVDFSEVALSAARRLARARGVQVEWLRADVLDFQPEVEAYDLVAVMYLQLPPRERRHVLGMARDSVAPSGILFVVAHDLLNLTQGAGGPSNPAVLYTPAELADDVRPLMVERAERVFRPVAGSVPGPVAVDALVKARRP